MGSVKVDPPLRPDPAALCILRQDITYIGTQLIGLSVELEDSAGFMLMIMKLLLYEVI